MLATLIQTLRKHAYSNIQKISPPKTENFQLKNSIFFHITAQHTDCRYTLEPPRRGGCNEYPQSMFLGKIKKNNVYPCKPQFYFIKVGFKGVRIIKACFRDGYDKKIISFRERETNCNFTCCQVPHFMIIFIPYINLLNLSWIIKVYF